MNPTDNQTPQPVDNELEELFDEYYPKGTVVANDNVDDEKAHIMTLVLEHRRDTFKARLLQWGTRQRLIELRLLREDYDLSMDFEPIDKRIAELQASLKDGDTK